MWHTHTIPACGRLRQEDHKEFKTSLGNIMRACLKTLNENFDVFGILFLLFFMFIPVWSSYMPQPPTSLHPRF